MTPITFINTGWATRGEALLTERRYTSDPIVSALLSKVALNGAEAYFEQDPNATASLDYVIRSMRGKHLLARVVFALEAFQETIKKLPMGSAEHRVPEYVHACRLVDQAVAQLNSQR